MGPLAPAVPGAEGMGQRDPADPPAAVIYDGSCPVCVAARAWIERRAVHGAFEFLACQDAERPRRFPMVSEAACMEAMQLVLPDGRVLAGDRAIPEMLRRLRRWRWLGGLFALPGAAGLAAGVYAWIARNRYAISMALPLGT